MIKKILKNKKGEIHLTYMITMLFLFWLLMLIIDVFRLTSSYLDIVDMVREITEVSASQGGYEDRAPDQFPIDGMYVTTSDLQKVVTDKMKDWNIKRGDLEFRVKKEVNGVDMVQSTWKMGSNTTGFRADYGSDIEVRLRFAFNFFSLPSGWTERNMVFTVSRNTKSQYKHRSSDWVGDEFDETM